MLTLERRTGEGIVFLLADGQRITLRVETKRRCKIRIDAPREVQIKREEILQR